jgi:CheY-like chemotaxis protein
MVRTPRILLVEDNQGDVVLVRKALTTVRPTRLYVVSDGVEALQFLRRSGPHEKVPRPDLVLLDLNLPRVNGREVLAEVKNDESLRRIPVVVLTGSDAEADVQTAFDLHCNAYMVKPGSTAKYRKLAETLVVHWFDLGKAPKK